MQNTWNVLFWILCVCVQKRTREKKETERDVKNGRCRRWISAPRGQKFMDAFRMLEYPTPASRPFVRDPLDHQCSLCSMRFFWTHSKDFHVICWDTEYAEVLSTTACFGRLLGIGFSERWKRAPLRSIVPATTEQTWHLYRVCDVVYFSWPLFGHRTLDKAFLFGMMAYGQCDQFNSSDTAGWNVCFTERYSIRLLHNLDIIFSEYTKHCWVAVRVEEMFLQSSWASSSPSSWQIGGSQHAWGSYDSFSIDGDAEPKQKTQSRTTVAST